MNRAPRPYDRDALAEHLPAEIPRDQVVVLDEVQATDVAARHLAMAGAEHGTVILAEQLRRPEGREGKHWFAPRALGLWMSVVAREPRELPEGLVNLSAQVAVAQALEALSPVRIALRWPNDLMIGARKVGAVLTEALPGAGGSPARILTVLLNVHQDVDDFPDTHREFATSLAQAGHGTVDREVLAAAVAGRLLRLLHALADDPGQVLAEYRPRDFLAGRTVFVDTGEGRVVGGSCRGVDPDGRLRIEGSGDPTLVDTGSVLSFGS